MQENAPKRSLFVNYSSNDFGGVMHLGCGKPSLIGAFALGSKNWQRRSLNVKPAFVLELYYERDSDRPFAEEARAALLVLLSDIAPHVQLDVIVLKAVDLIWVEHPFDQGRPQYPQSPANRRAPAVLTDHKRRSRPQLRRSGRSRERDA
jgi:hypothetical protein